MKQWLVRIVVALAVLVLLAGGVLAWGLLGSRPVLKGERKLPGLAAPVRVERDALGVPSIRASSRADAFRALGFLHGQERFFQMDLHRRAAAGELSGLLPGTLDYDKRLRIFRFRHRAGAVYGGLSPEDRRLLDAYTAGVNHGLQALSVRPFEYLVLRSAPEPWRAEDSILVAYSMYLDLEAGDGRKERSAALMADLLPGPIFRFFCRNSTIWESAIDGSTRPILPVPGRSHWEPLVEQWPEHPAWAPPSPPPEESSLPVLSPRDRAEQVVGSNVWALAGRHTTTGRALLAGDPHLGLRLPNIWYRVDYHYPDNQGNPLQITGASLPGVPMVIIGSNTRVAWSFTTLAADTEDLVRLIPDGDNARAYLTPDGPRPIEVVRETITPRSGLPVVREIRMSEYGPIIGEDADGRLLALRWSGFSESAFNMAWKDADRVDSVTELFDLAARQGMPVHNVVAADSLGNIGWAVIGWLPERKGYDGFLPVASNDPSWSWEGRLPPKDYPRIVNPDSGRVWNGNNRVVGGRAFELIGDGFPSDQARGWIIHEALKRMGAATELDMLELQVNIDGIQLDRWHTLLLSTVREMESQPGSDLKNLEQILARWDRTAAVDSVSYRLAREFRSRLRDRVLSRILAPLRESDPGFRPTHFPVDEPLWLLVSRQPSFLADPELGSWEAELQVVIREMLEDVRARTTLNIHTYTHGEGNRLAMRHPLSIALPFLARWLDMPNTPMDGDSFCVNAQTQAHGPSLRMVVSPGREAAGIFTMPGGQSGHPLSPHYRDHHALWLNDRPAPLLPGPTQNVLQLRPDTED